MVLDDVRTVLEEKEFQLWEKEGLLEYQEERLLDSEDQEVQMALYINILARSVLALNLTLPEGSRSSRTTASLARGRRATTMPSGAGDCGPSPRTRRLDRRVPGLRRWRSRSGKRGGARPKARACT